MGERMPPTTHNFDNSLKQSLNDALNPFWDRAYHVLHGDEILKLEIVTNASDQKKTDGQNRPPV